MESYTEMSPRATRKAQDCFVHPYRLWSFPIPSYCDSSYFQGDITAPRIAAIAYS